MEVTVPPLCCGSDGARSESASEMWDKYLNLFPLERSRECRISLTGWLESTKRRVVLSRLAGEGLGAGAKH